MRYGSLNNLIYPTGKLVVPEVGMGATMIMWSDRKPFTVIEVSKTGKTIRVQADNYVRTDSLGPTDSGQQYNFSPNLEGEIYTLRMTKLGWAHKRTRFSLGKRDCYYDYSF